MTDAAIGKLQLFDRIIATIHAAQSEGYEPVEVRLNHRDWLEAEAAFESAAKHATEAGVRDRLQKICGVAFQVTEAGTEGYLGETQLIGWQSRNGDGHEKWFPVICQNDPEKG